MAFKKQKGSNCLTILLMSAFFAIPVIATTNIDCKGKAFHCVNSTHFKICVDFGGVSKTVDDFLIPCPPTTVCTDNNYFECEYQITTTTATIPVQSDVTNELLETTATFPWNTLEFTTFLPINSNNRIIELNENTPTVADEFETTSDDIVNNTPINNILNEVHRMNILQNMTISELSESENNNKSADIRHSGSVLNDDLNNSSAAAVSTIKYSDTTNEKTSLFKPNITVPTKNKDLKANSTLLSYNDELDSGITHTYQADINFDEFTTPESNDILSPMIVASYTNTENMTTKSLTEIFDLTNKIDTHVANTEQSRMSTTNAINTIFSDGIEVFVLNENITNAQSADEKYSLIQNSDFISTATMYNEDIRSTTEIIGTFAQEISNNEQNFLASMKTDSNTTGDTFVTESVLNIFNLSNDSDSYVAKNEQETKMRDLILSTISTSNVNVFYTNAVDNTTSTVKQDFVLHKNDTFVNRIDEISPILQNADLISAVYKNKNVDSAINVNVALNETTEEIQKINQQNDFLSSMISENNTDINFPTVSTTNAEMFYANVDSTPDFVIQNFILHQNDTSVNGIDEISPPLLVKGLTTTEANVALNETPEIIPRNQQNDLRSSMISESNTTIDNFVINDPYVTKIEQDTDVEDITVPTISTTNLKLFYTIHETTDNLSLPMVSESYQTSENIVTKSLSDTFSLTNNYDSTMNYDNTQQDTKVGDINFLTESTTNANTVYTNAAEYTPVPENKLLGQHDTPIKIIDEVSPFSQATGLISVNKYDKEIGTMTEINVPLNETTDEYSLNEQNDLPLPMISEIKPSSENIVISDTKARGNGFRKQLMIDANVLNTNAINITFKDSLQELVLLENETFESKNDDKSLHLQNTSFTTTVNIIYNEEIGSATEVNAALKRDAKEMSINEHNGLLSLTNESNIISENDFNLKNNTDSYIAKMQQDTSPKDVDLPIVPTLNSIMFSTNTISSMPYNVKQEFINKNDTRVHRNDEISTLLHNTDFTLAVKNKEEIGSTREVNKTDQNLLSSIIKPISGDVLLEPQTDILNIIHNTDAFVVNTQQETKVRDVDIFIVSTSNTSGFDTNSNKTSNNDSYIANMEQNMRFVDSPITSRNVTLKTSVENATRENIYDIDEKFALSYIDVTSHTNKSFNDQLSYTTIVNEKLKKKEDNFSTTENNNSRFSLISEIYPIAESIVTIPSSFILDFTNGTQDSSIPKSYNKPEFSINVLDPVSKSGIYVTTTEKELMTDTDLYNSTQAIYFDNLNTTLEELSKTGSETYKDNLYSLSSISTSNISDKISVTNSYLTDIGTNTTLPNENITPISMINKKPSSSTLKGKLQNLMANSNSFRKTDDIFNGLSSMDENSTNTDFNSNVTKPSVSDSSKLDRPPDINLSRAILLPLSEHKYIPSTHVNGINKIRTSTENGEIVDNVSVDLNKADEFLLIPEKVSTTQSIKFEDIITSNDYNSPNQENSKKLVLTNTTPVLENAHSLNNSKSSPLMLIYNKIIYTSTLEPSTSENNPEIRSNVISSYLISSAGINIDKSKEKSVITKPKKDYLKMNIQEDIQGEDISYNISVDKRRVNITKIKLNSNSEKKQIMPINDVSNMTLKDVTAVVKLNKEYTDEKPTSTFCINRNHSKYSDENDCHNFYICIGRREPIIGKCPNNTVFSEILKQCTKNLSHCIRNNQFQCTSAGRFSDILSDKFYYMCVKKLKGYIRFKFTCQKGYHLDVARLKCLLDSHTGSKSDEDSSKSEKEKHTTESKSIEFRDSKDKKTDFQCKKVGKFIYPDDRRKYYQCTKTAKAEYRRRIKKCDSDEVFSVKKKKCVDDDSYESK